MEFNIDYLNQLIANCVEENPELEYKSAEALQNNDKRVMEMTKDVSAFANSNGGILIYGIAEDQTNKNLPGKIDTVDRKIITKEWLEQILNSRIRPRIHGLKINPIIINGDEVVYLLEVPKGETAHQADDKKYYRRHNFMVEPLFDHEIRDIMGRQTNPRINLVFQIVRNGSFKPGTAFSAADRGYEGNGYWLNVYAENVGNIYAKYVNIFLTLPKCCIKGNPYDQRNQSTEELKADNTVRDLIAPNASWHYQGPIAQPKQYGPARHEPVLPGMRLLLTAIPINDYSTDSGNNIVWNLYADNAIPLSGETAFSDIKYL